MVGIYILYENNTIVYVGKSGNNMLHRIRTHNIDKHFDKALMYEITNKSDMNILELYLISKYKPLYNKDSNNEDITTISINEDEILGEPIDVTEDALKWKHKNISKTHDYILAKQIIDELVNEGYSYKDILDMTE